MTAPLLVVDEVTRAYAGVTALAGVSLEVTDNAAFGLIGPNGAGKTTLFNIISAVDRPTSGRVLLDGRDIVRLTPYRVARLGISRTFQNIRLFPQLTVLQNLLVAQQGETRAGLRTLLPLARARERALRERAHALLATFGLVSEADRPAGQLPYGAQRRLEIARALATGPRLLLLDEPAAGMLPSEAAAVAEEIKRVREHECAVFLIEHHLDVVMAVCDRIAVLNFGRKIAEGTPAEVQRDEAVINAYLGSPV